MEYNHGRLAIRTTFLSGSSRVKPKKPKSEMAWAFLLPYEKTVVFFTAFYFLAPSYRAAREAHRARVIEPNLWR
jgi:hypothetical protein